MKNFLLLIFLSLFCQFQLLSQTSINSAIDQNFGHLDSGNQPGFFVGIIKSGNPIYARGFGNASIEHEVPFGASTVSDIGSVSKQLTVMGILLLHEQGKLSVDDPIHQHLGDLPSLNGEVLIKHLIYHTSGIPDVYALHSLKGFRGGDHISQSDAYRFLKARPLVDFIPGSAYRYSNTGYMLLAEIISKVSGQQFEDFMRQNIFSPLGMNHTYVMDVQGEIYSNMADSYVPVNTTTFKKIYDNSTLQGGGGVYASGYDMIKWIDNFRTRKIGSKESFEWMFTNATLNDGKEISYAGGINVDIYRGINRIHHNGSSAAARTRMVYYPDHEIGFIAKSNTTLINYEEYTQLEDLIIDHLLGEVAEPKPASINSPSTKLSTIQPNNPEEYSGKYYSSSLDLTLNLQADENGLKITNFYYAFPIVKYTEEDEFTNQQNQVNFIRDKDGIIQSIILKTPRASNLKFMKVK